MIFPYKQGSKSAKALKEALGLKLIKHENSSFKGSPEKIIINWGSSNLPEEVKKCKILNDDESVQIASNKKTFFEKVKGLVNIPEFTTDRNVAEKWLEDGEVVVIRELLTGSAGKGIRLFSNVSDFVNYNHNAAKLYVKYVPKKDEYRVHIVNGEVIDVRRKALKGDVPKELANWKIRNHDGGFIFQKSGFVPPKEVLVEACKAINTIGLHFGGVDVVWNNFRKKAYVLEINTAPGLEGSTIEHYKEAFKKIYEKKVSADKYMNFDFEAASQAFVEMQPVLKKAGVKQVWLDEAVDGLELEAGEF